MLLMLKVATFTKPLSVLALPYSPKRTKGFVVRARNILPAGRDERSRTKKLASPNGKPRRSVHKRS